MAPSTSPANNPAGWECGWPPSHCWLLALSFWCGEGERGNWMWVQRLLHFLNRKEKRKAGRERMLSRLGWGMGGAAIHRPGWGLCSGPRGPRGHRVMRLLPHPIPTTSSQPHPALLRCPPSRSPSSHSGSRTQWKRPEYRRAGCTYCR